MPGSRTLPVVAAALAVFAAAVAGCGTDEQVVRIGVLADCQGALRGFGDGELAGAELPFLRRGARLLGTGPGGGVSAIDVGGRRVELVQGCQETGEHTLYIEEARRLLENEHVDVVVGGASIVARELARRYPRAIFVSTFWDEQEITMRLPAANLFRFSPDYAQREAGLGAYAYHQLGWRRAAVVADYANPGWAGAAAFTAEFCALGGQVVATMKRQAPKGDFRSNLHRGGSAKAITATAAEQQTAIRAAALLGLGVAGVDLIRSRRGPLILEVNASPGLEGIETASGVDIAGSIIEHVAKGAKRTPTSHAHAFLRQA